MNLFARNPLSWPSRLRSKRVLITVIAISLLSGCGVVQEVSASGQTTLSPTSLIWGNVAVGNAGGPKSVTFTNSGSGTITFSSIAFTGTDAGDFAIYQNTCGATLAAAASCTTTVLFKPASTGARTAALVFTDSGSGSPQEVSLSGTGTGSVTIAPATLSFGTVTVGAKSASQTITVSNATSSSITLSAPSFSGSDPGDFSVSSTTCGASLAASSSCTASVLFSPAATGSRSATFNITGSDSSTALAVSLSGTGTATATGNVTVSPTSDVWGSVAVGNTSGAKSVTLTNTGSSAVSISKIAFSGANAGDFSISQNSCGTSLAATSTCTIAMLFKPTASGTRTATLTFTDNDPSSPQQVSVSGTGTGGSSSGTVSATPTSLSFGTVNKGSSSASQTITITNSTSSSATLSTGSITGTNAADFSISSTTCGSSLGASASCTAAIVFKPGTTGSESATWTMTSGSTSLSVSLSGAGSSSGSSGNVTVSPASISWSSVAVGNAGGQKTATLTNSGSSAVSINSIAFTGTDPGDFSIYTRTCGTSLAASSSCTVTILFKPTVAGTRTANLTFTDNGSSSPQQVAVSGLGTGGAVAASPASLSFGSVSEGTSSSSKTITVLNSTSSSISLSSSSITGTNAANFSISSTTCGSTLAASASCTAAIVFKPSTVGAESATWTMTGGSTPLSVALSGTGTGGSGSGTVSASPTSLSFGAINNGSTSPAQTITITNAASGSVTLGKGTLSGTDPTDFTISSTACGTTLAANASCTASIAFAPKTTGSLTTSWTMTASGSSTALSVALSGTGATPASGSASVSPTTVNFGNVAVGSPSATQTVKLYNGASSAIAVNSVTISGTNAGDFSINTNGCRTSALEPKASCSIGVIFQPTATGTRTATITFVDTAGNSPQAATLNGAGTAANSATITISPSSLSFGTQNIGVTSAAQNFTLTAGGSGTVSFTSFGFAGTDPNDFSITANTCRASLAAPASCTVRVAFKPAAIGNRVALFSIVDNATTTNQVAAVSGAGAYSTAQTPAAVTADFGSRSGSQVVIPSGILGTEYFESLPTNDNRTKVVQGGFTTARYRLEMQNIFTGSSMTDYTATWGALNNDMQKFSAAGVHPLVILEDTPSFLYPSPLRCSVQPETSVPSNVNEWGQLAAQIVAHLDTNFPGLVYQYEIWNEPNTAALCSANQLGDYISIYAAAAPQIKAQAKTDGVTGGVMVGGPATAGVSGSCTAVGTCTGFSEILTNASTAPYVDFYSYHFYVGTSTSIKDGMTWLPSGTPPSLYSMMMNSSSGVQKRFLEAYRVVKDATTPLGAKTPIFYDEYNDDWAFENDCCRNNATYGPLYNSLVVSQVLDSVYNGAATVPSRMIYFAAAQTTFCLLGIVDSATDCSKAVTGDQAQPYPQWYAYRMMFAPSFLDLQDGGHMAASVTLSSSARTNQLSATAFYTTNNDSVIIINPTANSYSGVTLQINNAGLTPSQSTLYTIACPLGHNPTNDASCGTNIVGSYPATLITTSGNLQATFDLPSYSVLAISLKK